MDDACCRAMRSTSTRAARSAERCSAAPVDELAARDRFRRRRASGRPGRAASARRLHRLRAVPQRRGEPAAAPRRAGLRATCGSMPATPARSSTGCRTGVLSRVDLLYPDPWPKRRQRKRRFVSDAMLARLARAMRPGAEFRFATDIDDYAGWTLARILASPDFAGTPRRPTTGASPGPIGRRPATRPRPSAKVGGRST